MFQSAYTFNFHLPEYPAMTAPFLLADCKAIAFDLDGTLLDTMHDIRASVSVALRDCGHGELPEDYLMPNLHGAFPAVLVAVMQDRNVPLSELDAVIKAYTKHYAYLAHRNSQPYPGVIDFLEDCQSRGVKLAICTNKLHASALKALEQKGLTPYFSVVLGSDSVSRPKPDAEPLLKAFEAMGVAPAQGAYVGDTHVDAMSANNAGVPFLWFRSGYGGELVHEYPQALAFDDYAELLGVPEQA
ncbi:HAD family hydrolase [Bordetella tumbae]